MIIYFLKLISIIVLVLLQYSFFNYAFPAAVVPNLILVVIIILVINDGFDVWPWIVFAGILADIQSFSIIGKNVIIFISSAYLINIISKSFLLDRHEKRISLVFVLLLVMTIFVNIFNIIWVDSFSIMNLGYLKGSFWSVLRATFVQSLFNVIIFYIIYALIDKVRRNILFHNKPSF